ncbi:MAG: hypothetical protein KDE14_08460 [Rhodobacteraceae bacterium]|nr:hypothetical protein [Paracoccaceae bacterium]
MKITVNVDCSPEEARAFLGLPDLSPLQDSAVQQMKAQMEKAMQTMGPEAVMKTLFPLGSDQLAEMQKAFWGSFTKG